ncbi:MAG: alpha/beta fold hydrolase [Lentisphaerae bacterium]|nr:alpha/beta fold hydrolase [Lentisphaerota bacterium]
MADNHTIDYALLRNAGTEKYFFETNKKIAYPEGEVVEWYGYRRHNFELEGCKGFIVEPPHPAPGLPWHWCTQWAEAFVPRTPALQLLERGFHHVHFNVFETYFNDEGIAKVEKFYAMLQSMGFHKKAALTGMSYGGLFSLRWAAEHPETVGAIYLDAPVCNLAFAAEKTEQNSPYEIYERHSGEARKHFVAYNVKDYEGLLEHPKNPLNNYLPIAKARIPILALRAGQDKTVFPESNIDAFSSRLIAAGGDIKIINRNLYGHHPHGMDDPTPLTGFILQHYPDFEI